ncbi:MAG: hypothetical protein ACI9KE_002695 [Polyangiales bacterium]|jgi:hypothetical protein
MFIKKTWKRRDFLAAAGLTSAAVALRPLFPLPEAEAQMGPKRLILITHAQGTDMTTWSPSGGERDFTLSRQLEPLAAYRDQMLVLDGVDNIAAYKGAASGHFGCSTLWTGAGIPEGTVRSEGVGWPLLPSIDQPIGAAVGEGTTFPAFHWGLYPTTFASGSNQGPNGVAHHRGDGQFIEPEIYPDRAFERLFDGVTGDSESIARIRRERGSVLDVVRGELNRVRAELPSGDRDRMDAHLEGIRVIENRLAELQPSCVVPDHPGEWTASDIRNFNNHPEMTALQFRLMNVALACDLTRVACFHWSHSEGNGSFMNAVDPEYDNFGSFHVLAHELSYENVGDRVISEEDRDVARHNMSNLNQWHARAIADDLLGMMSTDVLDRTLLVWASEMSEGGSHSNHNIPLVMVQGSEFDYFDTGRYLRWGNYDPITNFRPPVGERGEPMNKVLVSICNSMGVDVDRVGDESIPTGPLEELR